jgi:hypothetical protein
MAMSKLNNNSLRTMTKKMKKARMRKVNNSTMMTRKANNKRMMNKNKNHPSPKRKDE